MPAKLASPTHASDRSPAQPFPAARASSAFASGTGDAKQGVWQGGSRPARIAQALVIADELACARLAGIVLSVDDDAAVTSAASFAQACEAIECIVFSLVVVDVDLPDGLELIARVRQNQKAVPVLAVASPGRNDTVMAALHAGANGYVLKERDDVEVILSIKSMQRGGTPIDPDAVRWILSLLPQRVHLGKVADELHLSVREQEVLQLLARGCSNRDIAGLISLSRLTVEGYIKSLYRKLGVGSRTAAVFEAQRLGLLPY